MRNMLSLSPPAGVRVEGVMVHPARQEFSERLLEKRQLASI